MLADISGHAPRTMLHPYHNSHNRVAVSQGRTLSGCKWRTRAPTGGGGPRAGGEDRGADAGEGSWDEWEGAWEDACDGDEAMARRLAAEE